jgi:hypothetical protein
LILRYVLPFGMKGWPGVATWGCAESTQAWVLVYVVEHV